MTTQTKATLQGYFNTGDVPSEANFADLIDTAIVSDDVRAGLAAATAPSGANPFATMADVPAGGTSLTDYANTIVVDSGGRGDYTSLVTALDAITDAATTKRYKVFCFGTATNETYTAKTNVDVVGNIRTVYGDLSATSRQTVVYGTDHGYNTNFYIYRKDFANQGNDSYAMRINNNPAVTQTNTVYGLWAESGGTYADNGGGQIIALKAQTAKGGAGTNTAYNYAVDAVINNSGTGQLSHMGGFYVDHSFTGNATILESVGYTDILGVDAGTVVNYYGYYWKTPQINGTGAITNQYALYIENVTGAGTLNYAIYTNDGAVRFGDHVTIAAGHTLLVGANQVVGARVVDARADDTINASAWDATTAGVLTALRDAMIAHGLIAAA